MVIDILFRLNAKKRHTGRHTDRPTGRQTDRTTETPDYVFRYREVMKREKTIEKSLSVIFSEYNTTLRQGN